MAFDDYAISTKSSAVAAGAYPGIVGLFSGLGKQPNRFDPSKGEQTMFALGYRIATENGDVFWCKTYRATWGPKASFFKDCVMLFTAEEVKAGQLSPIALLERPVQLVFTAVRDESGQEKTVLAAVGPLPKTTANAETVKRLRECGTFQCDASKGETLPLEILKQLPKWLVEQMDQAAPGQPTAPPPTTSWTAPTSPTLAAMQGVPVQPAQHANAAPDFNDTLDDVNW